MMRYALGVLTLPGLFALWMLCEEVGAWWKGRKMRRDIRRAWAKLDGIGPHQLTQTVAERTKQFDQDYGRAVTSGWSQRMLDGASESQHATATRAAGGPGKVPVVTWHVTHDKAMSCAVVRHVKPDNTEPLPEGGTAYHSVRGVFHNGELRLCDDNVCAEAWAKASCGQLTRHCGVPDCPRWLVPALDTIAADNLAALQSDTPPGAPFPKKGGYSGSVPAKDVPPPPSTPSETIRPTNKVPNPLLGENLSEYIDGEVRRGAMWAEPTSFVHAGPERDIHDLGSEPCCDDTPDPDKADCPVWLPTDPVVPYKDRTPCCLDSGHDGDHEPMDKGTLERAQAIAKMVRFGKWDDAAEQYDRETSLDIARHRRWVQLTVIGSPPIGLPMRQADPLEVHNAIAPLLGFELVSSVSATVLDTPAAVND